MTLLSVFCGKGGVGKTSFSLAFGLMAARSGKRTLVVTSHPIEELRLSLSLQGLTESDPRAAAHLFVVHIDPREILARTLRKQFPSRIVANRVLSSRLYKNLIEVAPGLKEIAFLARLKELTESGENGENTPYDSVIWDAPATGHFLETMRATRKFETYLVGPMAAQGQELNQFFSDARIQLLPVCTLEEMAVEETLDLCEKLAADLDLHPDGLICNMVSPLLLADAEELDRMADHDGFLEFLLHRHQTERRHFQRLQASLNAPFHVMERVGRHGTDLEFLFVLCKLIQQSSLGDACES